MVPLFAEQSKADRLKRQVVDAWSQNCMGELMFESVLTIYYRVSFVTKWWNAEGKVHIA